jgi:hypothetical protein
MTVFGLPLVHIASARDPEGKKMRVACGVIAIGDVAIGGVAIGVFSFGGIAIGGTGVGLISFGGIVLGLLTAIGGLGAGGFVVAGLAIGLVTLHPLQTNILGLTDTWSVATLLLGSLIAGLGFVIGVVAAIYAWVAATRERPSRGG